MSAERGFFATWAAITFRADRFFSSPAAERSHWSPLGFALGVGAIALGASAFFSVLALSHSISKAAGAGFGAVVVSPIPTLIGLGFFAGVGHLLLVVVGGRSRPFRETFQCICYAHAPAILGVVPVWGTLAGWIWQVIVLSIGLTRVQSTTPGRAVFASLTPVLMPVVLVLGLRVFVIEAFHIPAGSMAPTLIVGDHIFINKMVYRFSSPRRGDVIVFKYPEDPDKDFVKRIVAVGEDTIEIRGNLLYVNGERVPRERVGSVTYQGLSDEVIPPRIETGEAEEFRETLDGRPFSIYLSPGRSYGCPPPARFGCGGASRVPPHTVFVLGDNRDNSHDSRFWGFVPDDYIKGRAMVVWWSEDWNGPRWSRFWQQIR